MIPEFATAVGAAARIFELVDHRASVNYCGGGCSLTISANPHGVTSSSSVVHKCSCQKELETISTVHRVED